MFYQSELRFLRDTFKKCHLQTLLIDPKSAPDKRIDLGLRGLIYGDGSYKGTFSGVFEKIEDNTIHKFTDQFGCYYMFLSLPAPGSKTVFVIGPYMAEEISSEQILEQAELVGVPPQNIKKLERYYDSVPLISEQSQIFAMLDTFAEYIWQGADNFTVSDINQEYSGNVLPFKPKNENQSEQDTLWDMQIMEQRYAYENEMMQAVSLGQTHKVEQILHNFSHIKFEQRLSDPLRNLKNYCIIMNTLLRKSAEKGGVHPIYLDGMSSAYARKIEQLPATSAMHELMGDMFRSYCRLVRKHSVKQYSPPVQKAVIYIESDLTADLSLSTLAKMQNVSSSYLSNLFKQQTGKTLTDYVNQKRVKYAKQLLKNTNLQIQTVAQHCGILDVQYFSKVFKKYANKTPKEFRDSENIA